MSTPATNQPPRRTATARQLEDQFGPSREFWRQLARTGKIRNFKVGARRLVYDLDQVEALLAEGQLQQA